MSRIGKKPIDIPAGVKVTIADGNVLVEGKAKLSMALPPRVTAEVKEKRSCDLIFLPLFLLSSFSHPSLLSKRTYLKLKYQAVCRCSVQD